MSEKDYARAEERIRDYLEQLEALDKERHEAEISLEAERKRNAELVTQSGCLIAAADWWRDYATRLANGQGGFPESPYPPESYGVPMPPAGVPFGGHA